MGGPWALKTREHAGRKKPFLSPKRILAGTLVSSLFIFQAGIAAAADTDVSEARGQVISSDLLGLDLLDAATSEAGVPSNPGTHYEPLNVDALGAVGIQLPGIGLPLLNDGTNNGLLDLGSAGALHSFAQATTPTAAKASAGLVGPDGAIDVNAGGGGNAGNAQVHLTPLLDQLQVSGLTNEIINKLDLEIGALASTATLSKGAATSDYTVADLKAEISSPLVGNLSKDLGVVVNGVGTTLNGAVGDNGAISSALEKVLNTQVNLLVAKLDLGPSKFSIGNLDTALKDINDGLLKSTITDENGVVALNLANGTVTVDLEKAMVGGLNGQPANTEVINDATLQRVTDGLSDALGSLTQQLSTALTKAINGATLTLDTGLAVTVGVPPVGSITKGTLVIDGALGDFLGTSGTKPVVDANISLAGAILNPLLDWVATGLLVPLTQSVGTLANPLLKNMDGNLDAVVDPVLKTLSPVIDGVLRQAVSVTVNKQTGTLAPLTAARALAAAEEADFGVSALALTLLPAASAANVGLSTSYVRGAVADLAGVAITSPAPGSEISVATGETADVPVRGTGEPGQNVVVVLDGDESAPQTATVGDDGTWTVTFPGVSPGTHDVVATQPADESEAETDFVVTEEAAADTATDTDTAADTATDTDTAADTATDTDTATAADAANNANSDSASNGDADASTDVTITNPTDGQNIETPNSGGVDVPVSGKGDPGATVVVTLDGGASQTVTVDENGDWSTTLKDVAPGKHKVTATQESDGTEASVEFLVTVVAGDATATADAGSAANGGTGAGADDGSSTVSVDDGNGGALASTGSTSLFVGLVALILLLVGGAAVLISRRRSVS